MALGLQNNYALSTSNSRAFLLAFLVPNFPNGREGGEGGVERLGVNYPKLYYNIFCENFFFVKFDLKCVSMTPYGENHLKFPF